MSAEHQELLINAFSECKNFETLLGVYTGACSTLFQTDDGSFDTERASDLMFIFKSRLQELMFAANMEGDTMAVDQFVNRFFRSK